MSQSENWYLDFIDNPFFELFHPNERDPVNKNPHQSDPKPSNPPRPLNNLFTMAVANNMGVSAAFGKSEQILKRILAIEWDGLILNEAADHMVKNLAQAQVIQYGDRLSEQSGTALLARKPVHITNPSIIKGSDPETDVRTRYMVNGLFHTDYQNLTITGAHAAPSRAPRARTQMMNNLPGDTADIIGGDFNLHTSSVKARFPRRKIVSTGVLHLASKPALTIVKTRTHDVGSDHRMLVVTYKLAEKETRRDDKDFEPARG